MSYTKSTGSRRGIEGPEGRAYAGPKRQTTVAQQTLQALYVRAFELVRHEWTAGHWKSSVATKAVAYLQQLAGGNNPAPPTGVSDRILGVVRRSFAQACLEHEVTDLSGQRATWYLAAVVAAREQLQQG